MRALSVSLRLCAVCRAWRTAVLIPTGSTLSSTHSGITQPTFLPELLARSLLPQAAYAAKARKAQSEPTDGKAGDGFALILEDASRQMQATVDRLEHALSSVRTGRVSPGLLDHLPVLAYGDRLSLQSLAQVSLQDAHTLIVTPFDPQTLSAIEKAIADSALQLSPKSTKSEITVPVPKPSQETLKAMGKMVKQEAEAARVAVRQVRKGAVGSAKALASEDDTRRAEAQVQKVTDHFVNTINTRVEQKEAELSKAL